MRQTKQQLSPLKSFILNVFFICIKYISKCNDTCNVLLDSWAYKLCFRYSSGSMSNSWYYSLSPGSKSRLPKALWHFIMQGSFWSFYVNKSIHFYTSVFVFGVETYTSVECKKVSSIQAVKNSPEIILFSILLSVVIFWN